MTQPATLTEYYKSLSPDRAKRLRSIQQLIRQEFPKAKASMKYRLPTFETGEQNWIAMASQKHYISVYTCSKEVIAPFVERHPEIKCGTGCLKFRDTQNLHLDDLKKVIVKALGGN